MSEIWVFPLEQLPPGFRYPQAFVALCQDPKSLESSSWWLLGQEPEFAQFCLKLVRAKGGSKVLIPFAKDDESGDLACFDGADTTGSPRVYFDTGEESYAGIDWNSRYSQSFAEWLDEVLEGA